MLNKTIYILHGWAIDPANEKKWHTFRTLLKKQGVLSKFLPLPGITTQLDEAWTLDSYVNWLEQQLPKDAPVTLLGHSFGGQICCQFAAQYPERVDKLILIDSAGIKDTSVRKILKRGIFKFFAKLGKPIFRHSLFRTVLYKLAREQDYLHANELQRQTMVNVINTEIVDYLPQIKCPTLILWGKNDMATPLKFAHQFQSLIPTNTLHVITEARHSPQFTHQEETAQVIGAFLK